MRVSLCMIVRNEEASLRECLASVEGLWNDLVVVDTGSSDGTKAVAVAHGARVFDFPWCDDFSAARNESLRHALGDWVFWMDADDRLRSGSRPKLQGLLSELPDASDGYLMRCACTSDAV